MELLGTLEKIGTIKTTVPIQASGRGAAGGKIWGSGRSIKVQSGSLGRASVYNLRGELVKSQIVRQGETEIGGIKAGVYLVKLSNGAVGMAKLRQLGHGARRILGRSRVRLACKSMREFALANS